VRSSSQRDWQYGWWPFVATLTLLVCFLVWMYVSGYDVGGLIFFSRSPMKSFEAMRGRGRLGLGALIFLIAAPRALPRIFRVLKYQRFRTFFGQLRPSVSLYIALDVILQELLFRKLLLEFLLQKQSSLVGAFTLHSFAFVLYHFLGRAYYKKFQEPRSRTILRLFLSMGQHFCLGVLYGFLYIWSGSIIWPCVYHWCRNYLARVFFYTYVRVIFKSTARYGYVFVENVAGYKIPLPDGKLPPLKELLYPQALLLAMRFAKRWNISVSNEML
jgi:membrane protease YdiL (CAAX protease family)